MTQSPPRTNLAFLGQDGWEQFAPDSLTLPWNEFIPIVPTHKQLAFLLLLCREAFYGGAAGPGKSVGLLAAALQYVHIPGYAAILFRQAYTDLSLPNALMPMAQEWLAPTRARWDEKAKTWHFPSGATLTFGYLDGPRDRFRYQSAEFQFVGFDELTQFREADYIYVGFSRTRRLLTSDIPIRTRSASNPGDIGHAWVKQRFITEGIRKGRVFIPATLDDNPYIDQEEYIKSLQHLDPTTRAQLLRGDWTARTEGGKFRREWFEIVDVSPSIANRVRYWDLAATEVSKRSRDPDFTVGFLMSEVGRKTFYIEDIRRMRATPATVEDLIVQTAKLDGKAVAIYMEQEPGASGVNTIAYYRSVLAGYTFYGVKTSGSKEVRANPVSSQAEAGNVKLLAGPWINEFLDEIEGFPSGAHDDQVDAMAGAFEQLTAEEDEEVVIVYDVSREVNLDLV
ncbi:hypothetical protein ES708_12019 [subsurface metagenome]